MQHVVLLDECFFVEVQSLKTKHTTTPKFREVIFNTFLSLLNHEKRRHGGRVNLHDSINNIIQLFQPFFTDRKVEIETEFSEGSPWLLGSEAAIESIITNLINNSLVALESTPPKDRQIIIRTIINESVVSIAILDSGVGIQDIRIRDLWLPGKTTKKNGTGLGLAIVRDTVVDIGGKVKAIEKSSLGGAEIIIELPIIGV